MSLIYDRDIVDRDTLRGTLAAGQATATVDASLVAPLPRPAGSGGANPTARPASTRIEPGEPEELRLPEGAVFAWLGQQAARVLRALGSCDPAVAAGPVCQWVLDTPGVLDLLLAEAAATPGARERLLAAAQALIPPRELRLEIEARLLDGPVAASNGHADGHLSIPLQVGGDGTVTVH